MKVLFSIKPEFVSRIFSGLKKYEYRKSVFKQQNIKVMVIYATMPVGKVVGECEIETIVKDSPENLWAKTNEFSGINKAFFDEYFEHKEEGYAIKITRVTRYKIPKELKEVCGNNIPPQSFRYIREATKANLP